MLTSHDDTLKCKYSEKDKDGNILASASVLETMSRRLNMESCFFFLGS